MKIILKIARNELRNLFYSPVAWFLAILFFIQCGYYYTASLHPFALQQDLFLKNSPNWKDFGGSLTQTIFFSFGSVFGNVYQNLFLFIPLLTMSLVSREVSSGSIKLLYSSPIKIRDIVFGKYLAVMIYNLLLIAIVGIFIISGILNIKSADTGWLLSAAFGFCLLVSAFSAIGLFMSSVTNYQIVSAIGTFTILFVLLNIGSLWQKYDFIRDLTYFLSIAGRTEKMIAGLITSKDIIYFLIIVVMFLVFTYLKLKGESESKSWLFKAIGYISVLLVSVLLGYVSSRPELVVYWDTTATQRNTIHPRTQEIFRKTGEEPIEVTLYTNILGNRISPGLPEGRNWYLHGFWESYLRFKPSIRFKYVYYYDNDGRFNGGSYFKAFPNKTEKQIAGIQAQLYGADESMFIGPKEIRTQTDPYQELLGTFMTLRYKGKEINLRTFDDNQVWPDEALVAAAVKRLTGEPAPKVYFLTGNLERSILKTGEREFSRQSVDKENRTSLVNMGFEVDTISLEHRNVPADIGTLVIADPKRSLSPVVTAKIEKYLDKGGNAFILSEPGKQDIVNPILKPLGIELNAGTLVQLSENETPDKVGPIYTDEAFDLAEEQPFLQMKRKRKGNDRESFIGAGMPGVTAIETLKKGPFMIIPILKTAPMATWLKKGRLVIDSVPPVFSPEEGDFRDSTFNTAVQLTRQMSQKQQRIIVASDADFRSNLRVAGEQSGNAFYSWLNYNTYPVYIPGKVPEDVKLRISESGASLLKIMYVWVVPGLLSLAGILLLVRRRRK